MATEARSRTRKALASVLNHARLAHPIEMHLGKTGGRCVRKDTHRQRRHRQLGEGAVVTEREVTGKHWGRRRQCSQRKNVDGVKVGGVAAAHTLRYIMYIALLQRASSGRCRSTLPIGTRTMEEHLPLK